jgi:DNA-directed RNA polymerase subunit RPC12/RpoP
VANEDDPISEEHDPGSGESPCGRLKRGLADLARTFVSQKSGPVSHELGKALETLINSGADGEVRLDALLVLLSITDGSLQDFGKLVGMPVTPDADPESVEVVLESCRLLLSLSLEDGAVKVEDRTSSERNNHTLTSSEARDQLLLHFASFSGGAVEEIRTKFDWEGVLGEPLDSAIAKLKVGGALLSLGEPKWHILYKKNAEELVNLCRDHGLNAFGTIEDLADRLVSVDPSGLVLGYPGELLKCSSETRRSLARRMVQGRADNIRDNATNDTMPPRRADPFQVTGGVQLDLRKPECPYCHRVLTKIPGRKTKCPHCGQFIFVRTRPADGARVVVTQAEVDRIEEDWSIVTAATDPDFSYVTTRQEAEEERERLKLTLSSGGQEPASDDEVKWSLLNKLSARHASNKEWGLYRNIQVLKADFLTRRCKFADALRHYIYVCVLDLNAQDRPGLYPHFLDQVARISTKLRLGRDEIRQLLNCCSVERGLPLSVDDCWSYLQNALWPSSSSLREDIPVPGRPDCVWQVLELPRGTETIARTRSILPSDAKEFF